MRFLKRFPGFENLHLERLQPEAGVRETYRIVGRTTVRVGPVYTSGRVFDDAIAYFVLSDRSSRPRGRRPRQLKARTVATIPSRAHASGLSKPIIAGRPFSSDRLRGNSRFARPGFVHGHGPGRGRGSGACGAGGVGRRRTSRWILSARPCANTMPFARLILRPAYANTSSTGTTRTLSDARPNCLAQRDVFAENCCRFR